jgi:hypothetical protein
MCLLCAAVPATVAVGAAANAKQLKEQRAAEEHGEMPQKTIPARTVTRVAVGALVAAPALYHAQLGAG